MTTISILSTIAWFAWCIYLGVTLSDRLGDEGWRRLLIWCAMIQIPAGAISGSLQTYNPAVALLFSIVLIYTWYSYSDEIREKLTIKQDKG